jgi:hypothetical protein
VFSGLFGHDTIDDFRHGDVIKFERGLFQDFHAVPMASQQVGHDTVITFYPANSITLDNVALASLHANDFLLA